MGALTFKSIMDYTTLCFVLKKYKYPRDKITQLLKAKTIIRVKKGLYIYPGPNLPNFAPVANLIYGPSYISKEWALAFYGLIPERVFEFTCMTLGRNKVFETPVGRFSYQSIPKSYYAEGIVRAFDEEGLGYLVASKEKALCDLLYHKTFEGMEDIQMYLQHLRLDEFKSFSISALQRLAQGSQKISIELLYQYRKNL